MASTCLLRSASSARAAIVIPTNMANANINLTIVSSAGCSCCATRPRDHRLKDDMGVSNPGPVLGNPGGQLHQPGPELGRSACAWVPPSVRAVGCQHEPEARLYISRQPTLRSFVGRQKPSMQALR